jgi:hypothetical protein
MEMWVTETKDGEHVRHWMVHATALILFRRLHLSCRSRSSASMHLRHLRIHVQQRSRDSAGVVFFGPRPSTALCHQSRAR